MGCNTSQEQLSASNIDVRDNNHKKSSGVGKKYATNHLDNNENHTINETELMLDDFGQDEEFAATKIQAAFRGHQTRTAMKRADNTSLPDSNKKDDQPTPPKPAELAKAVKTEPEPAKAAACTENQPTKEELEAEFDPNDQELCEAAKKIQATFRGHMQKKVANNDCKVEDVDIEEITKKVAEELDIDLTDPELHKAATKIQASFRGHKTRKQEQ